MKVILYMGISINGYIAKENGDSEWTSEEDLQGFYQHSKIAGNIVMGANTFKSASDYGYFPFPDALNVVMTQKEIENTWEHQAVFTNDSPKDVLKMLEEKGYKEAFVAGGGRLNSSFMKEKLIDEIYLDVEPLVLGKGIKLFAEDDFEFDLEFIESKNINLNTIQLHYRVVKG
ncbi:MAG TPA: dihydrofolate reductase family protein [Patescibacteria group bacterium]|nr:dihydrofolate reductase family protein [Patescibacteria group bacterium]